MKLTPRQRLASACADCSQNGRSCLSHTCIDCQGYVPGDFAHECILGPGPSAPPDPATLPEPTTTQRGLSRVPELTPTELEDEREQDLADFINRLSGVIPFKV